MPPSLRRSLAETRSEFAAYQFGYSLMNAYAPQDPRGRRRDPPPPSSACTAATETGAGVPGCAGGGDGRRAAGRVTASASRTPGTERHRTHNQAGLPVTRGRTMFSRPTDAVLYLPWTSHVDLRHTAHVLPARDAWRHPGCLYGVARLAQVSISPPSSDSPWALTYDFGQAISSIQITKLWRRDVLIRTQN